MNNGFAVVSCREAAGFANDTEEVPQIGYELRNLLEFYDVKAPRPTLESVQKSMNMMSQVYQQQVRKGNPTDINNAGKCMDLLDAYYKSLAQNGIKEAYSPAAQARNQLVGRPSVQVREAKISDVSGAKADTDEIKQLRKEQKQIEDRNYGVPRAQRPKADVKRYDEIDERIEYLKRKLSDYNVRYNG